MDRRRFFGVSAAAGGLLAARPLAAQPTGPAYSGAPKMDVQVPLPQQQQFRIGYTTNTRGGWEGSPFVGISEARDVGFRFSRFSVRPFALRPTAWNRRRATPRP